MQNIYMEPQTCQASPTHLVNQAPSDQDFLLVKLCTTTLIDNEASDEDITQSDRGQQIWKIRNAIVDALFGTHI